MITYSFCFWGNRGEDDIQENCFQSEVEAKTRWISVRNDSGVHPNGMCELWEETYVKNATEMDGN